MSLFEYRARDIQGTETVGQLEAKDLSQVHSSLSEKGLFPIHIEIAPQKKELSLKRSKKFGSKELASFTKQFEVMFSVGMPIDKILTTLIKQAEDQNLKSALQSIHHDVSGGARLSEAFGKYPKYFNKLYIAMVEIGQSAGVLDKALIELASILRKEHDIQSKMRSALLYPKIVLFTLIAVSWAMLVFVFPPFKSFYNEQGAQLPLPTQMVIGLSDLFVHYWYLPIFLAMIIYLTWRQIKDWSRVEHWVGRLALSVPIFGNLNILASNARFAHLIAALYRVGLPLPQALSIVANTFSNVCHRNEILILKGQIEHGHSLYQSMEPLQYFSPMIKETCGVGEQTGKLDSTLDATAGFYDKEVDEILKNLSTLIEPVMLLMLFGAVLLLALAVYLPIWNMSKVVLH